MVITEIIRIRFVEPPIPLALISFPILGLHSKKYSPDLNPIEEFFAELKAFIKKQWHEYEDNPYQDFKLSLNGVLVWWEAESRAQEVTSGMLGGVSMG